MILFDTHTHLDDEQFDGRHDDIVARACEAGVQHIVAVGTTAESSGVCVELAERLPGVVAAVGIQPNYTAEAAAGEWDSIVSLAGRPGVVALGETGLDRHWDFAPFDVQQDYFDRHLRLAQERDLPFIVHMRDCEEDILQMLRDARSRGPLTGIMHSYTGSAAGAREAVELGLCISFAGMLTYKKSTELRAVATDVPDDRLLIETDCPYLSPEPVRGKRPCEPAYLVHTAACLAEVRGVSVEELARQTTANAQRLFGLSPEA